MILSAASYLTFERLVEQTYENPRKGAYLAGRLALQLGPSDPLLRLVRVIREVGEKIQRREPVETFVFLHPDKMRSEFLQDTFFAHKMSFEGRDVCLISLEEMLEDTPFEGSKLAVPILRTVLSADRTEQVDFSFLRSDDPEQVNTLFAVLDYFGFEKFQERFLEPFHEKFPLIPLEKVPRTVQTVECKFLIDTQLQEVERLRFAQFIGAVPVISSRLSSEEILARKFVFVRPQDFRRLEGLRSLEIQGLRGEHAAVQSSLLPSGLQRLSLLCKNIPASLREFNFSRVKNLEILQLCRVEHFTSNQLQELSSSLKELDLSFVDITNLDFSSLTKLKVLRLRGVEGFSKKHLDQLPRSLRALTLERVGGDITQVDFSQFSQLKELFLKETHVTREQMENLPKTLEGLRFPELDMRSFDLARLPPLKRLDLMGTRHLSRAQLSMLPLTLDTLYTPLYVWTNH